MKIFGDDGNLRDISGETMKRELIQKMPYVDPVIISEVVEEIFDAWEDQPVQYGMFDLIQEFQKRLKARIEGKNKN